jgi:flagellar assembly factor FliW
MQIQSHRFGVLKIESKEIIRFPEGIIGFPNEREYVLLRKSSVSAIGWLQSMTNPSLAFPVVSVDALMVDSQYFDALTKACATLRFGTIGDKLAVMAIVCALTNGPASVNLLAPIVVRLEDRIGAQIFLLDGDYSTEAPLVMFRCRETGIANAEAPAGAA